MRFARSLSSSLSVVLLGGVVAVLPPLPVWAASSFEPDRSVAVSPFVAVTSPARERPGQTPPSVPVWPSAGSVVVDVPAVGARLAASPVMVGGLQVTVSAPVAAGAQAMAAASPVSRVRVEVLDRAAAQRSGGAVALRVSRADGGSGPGRVNVAVSYGGFRQAFGGAWAARALLRLVRACPIFC